MIVRRSVDLVARELMCGPSVANGRRWSLLLYEHTLFHGADFKFVSEEMSGKPPAIFC